MVGLTIKQSIIANPFLIYFGAISQHSPTETVGVSILWSARFPPKEGIIDADHFLQDEFEVTIIDWEKSGWYASYWEYCLAFAAIRWDDDWGLFLREILSPYHVETLFVKTLRLELWS